MRGIKDEIEEEDGVAALVDQEAAWRMLVGSVEEREELTHGGGDGRRRMVWEEVVAGEKRVGGVEREGNTDIAVADVAIRGSCGELAAASGESGELP